MAFKSQSTMTTHRHTQTGATERITTPHSGVVIQSHFQQLIIITVLETFIIYRLHMPW